MLYQEYEKLIQEINSAKTPTEIEDILSKMEMLDFTLKMGIDEPAGWRTSNEIMDRYKNLLKYPLELKIKNHPNHKKMQLVSDLITEGTCSKNSSPMIISKFLRKVEKSFGSEIGFPSSIVTSFRSEDISRANGINRFYITEEDLESVLIRLESYLSELSFIKKDKPSKSDNKITPQPINIYATANANNQITINIDVQITSTMQLIEDDDNLSESEVEECKSILSELKSIQNEKPKKKWEKCKTILTWLGDKTVKFAQWFIPIISTILSNQ